MWHLQGWNLWQKRHYKRINLRLSIPCIFYINVPVLFHHPNDGINYIYILGQDVIFSVATCYGLDGPAIESLWGWDFCIHPDWPWGPPSLLCNGYWVFPGGKVAGTWRWPPTPSSAEIKERVELYLYSTFGPSWPVRGWTLSFTFYTNWRRISDMFLCTCTIFMQHIMPGL